jgi:radical SAM protein with 4Fe4S-binding SPASM domain
MQLIRSLKNIVETNRHLDDFYSWVASQRPYKAFVHKKINKYIDAIKKSRQYSVIIETTNICNAKCVMCPHIKMERQKETMSEETFDLIVKRLKEDKIEPLAFVLNGFGEPLIDARIIKRVNALKKEFPKSVLKFYSNFQLANDAIVKEIVLSGLDEINVSFNGFDKDSYEKTMGINYERTLENINKLIKERNKNNKNLKIRLSMALVSYNEKGIRDFFRYWESKVDSVNVNRVHTYGDSIENPAGKIKLDFNKPLYPCKSLFNVISIGVRGDIFLCCLDYEGNYNFGNIRNERILDIYYSQKFEDIRKIHLKGDAKKMKICSKCSSIYHYGADWVFKNIY